MASITTRAGRAAVGMGLMLGSVGAFGAVARAQVLPGVGGSSVPAVSATPVTAPLPASPITVPSVPSVTAAPLPSSPVTVPGTALPGLSVPSVTVPALPSIPGVSIPTVTVPPLPIPSVTVPGLPTAQLPGMGSTVTASGASPAPGSVAGAVPPGAAAPGGVPAATPPAGTPAAVPTAGTPAGVPSGMPGGVPAAGLSGAVAGPAGDIAPTGAGPMAKAAPVRASIPRAVRRHGAQVVAFALVAVLLLVVDLSAGIAMIKRFGVGHFIRLVPGLAARP